MSGASAALMPTTAVKRFHGRLTWLLRRSACLLVGVSNGVAAQSWIDTRASIEELVASGRFSEAAQLGSELLQLAVDESDESSLLVAESHYVVARLHVINEEYFQAEDTAMQAIDLYTRNDGPQSPSLINPYVVLGDALQGAGAEDLALGAYNEARGIVRRNFGLHDGRQVDILEKMALSMESIARIDDALNLRLEAIDIVHRLRGPYSAESRAALYLFAEWLADNDLFFDAARQFRAVASYAIDDPLEQVRLLRLAADNFRQARDTFDNARVKRPPVELFDALAVVESLREDLTLLRAEIWLDIGDWYVAFSDQRNIKQAYLRATEILAGIDTGNAGEIERQWFSRTVPVYLTPLRSPALSTEEYAQRGTIELRFRVNPNGTADGIEVISADPPGLLDRSARRRVDNSRFRPLLENGQLAESVREIRFDFSYDPESVD